MNIYLLIILITLGVLVLVPVALIIICMGILIIKEIIRSIKELW